MEEIKMLERDYLEVCVDKRTKDVIISNCVGDATYIDASQIDSVVESLQKAKTLLDP